MAGLREGDKQYFPLKNIDSVVDLFRDHLNRNNEPDLALLSIVLGCIENVLTSNRSLIRDEKEKEDKTTDLPLVKLATVQALYQRFVTYIKGSVDLTEYTTKYATRDFVKRVSDVVWSGLTRGNYQDKAHLQSLYSYLTGYKLDCFGVALGVVAACQILGYNDVHLSLSEDHAWVVFGFNGNETAEVTWHGKGVEDKRGLPITIGVAEKSWLYLNDNAVVCDRYMEVAAIVSSINPAINATMDSVEVAQLQQDLLWLLHDLGHLNKYPMALGTLGDLEELEPTPLRPSAEHIYRTSVRIAKDHYQNKHVYPYTYLGSYYYRKGLYKEALRAWANAAEAISHYNYNREDEEIYKEFLEIAHDLIPHIIKLASDGYLIGSTHHQTVKTTNTSDCVGSLDFLKDRENYELILKFYDGICEWEEGSSTPVLHITWAKHFIFGIAKFSGSIREGMEVEKGSDDDTSSDSSSENDEEVAVGKHPVTVAKRKKHHHVNGKNQNKDLARSRGRPRSASMNSLSKSGTVSTLPYDDNVIIPSPTVDCLDNNNTVPQKVGNNGVQQQEEKIKNTIAELASKVDVESSEESQNESTDTNIADLAKACGESILNPDFLLGKGEPFTTGSSIMSVLNTTTDSKVKSFSYDLSKFSNDYNRSISATCTTTTAVSPANATYVFKNNGCQSNLTSQCCNVGGGDGLPLLNLNHTQSVAPISGDSIHHSFNIQDMQSQQSNSPSLPPLFQPSCVESAEERRPLSSHTALLPVNGSYKLLNQMPTSPISPLISCTDNMDSSTVVSIMSSPQQKLKFRSAKLKGLKNLLVIDKLNTSAITLQLTAQSQVFFKRSKSSVNQSNARVDYGGPRKRTRRE